MIPAGNDDAIVEAVKDIEDRIAKARQDIERLEITRQGLLDIIGGSNLGVPGGFQHECPFTADEMNALGDERLIARRIAERMPERKIHRLTVVRYILRAGCTARSEDALRTYFHRYMSVCADWSSPQSGWLQLVGDSAEALEVAEATGSSTLASGDPDACPGHSLSLAQASDPSEAT